MSETGPVEVWRGGVNAWECDEMGHMNVRFYLARAQEGLAGVALELGAPQAFAPHAAATLQVRSHHVRFLREARAGDALRMTGGVVEMDETEAVVVQLLTHAEGDAPCAGFLTRVAHATPAKERGFPWPERAREAARRLRTAVPPWAGPRSIQGTPPCRATLADARALDLSCITRTVVGAQDCDVFGRMGPDRILGRLSEGAGVLMSGIRRALSETGAASRVGGAALEFRLTYADLPRAGDHLEVRSGFIALESKVQRIGHWVLDPVSGRAWVTAQAVIASFDLDARKIIPIPQPLRDAFAARRRPPVTA